ncbi:MAG: transposase [Candidatus Dormibacteraeota bacterium]|nr:transposase [Candidatus Dormibacteraeota bacterium]MBO0704605.1 transposase [Candidatus Dormibacteraeota bacterium]MBO0762380.1 transposase [Candidatus Dormibacteraeota bacterium]
MCRLRAPGRGVLAAHGVPRLERVTTDDAFPCRNSRDVPGRSGSPGGRAPARPSLPPQTNGKVERFKRVLLDGWAYVRPYDGNEDRVALLPHRLHSHNFHRGHTSLGGRPPISRVDDLGGNST